MTNPNPNPNPILFQNGKAKLKTGSYSLITCKRPCELELRIEAPPPLETWGEGSFEVSSSEDQGAAFKTSIAWAKFEADGDARVARLKDLDPKLKYSIRFLPSKGEPWVLAESVAPSSDPRPSAAPAAQDCKLASIPNVDVKSLFDAVDERAFWETCFKGVGS